MLIKGLTLDNIKNVKLNCTNCHCELHSQEKQNILLTANKYNIESLDDIATLCNHCGRLRDNHQKYIDSFSEDNIYYEY